MAVITTPTANATANAVAAVNTTATNSASDRAQAALAGDFDSFLRLLTTQLKNQDPTSPLDTNQFTQQIATLSQVEQAIATNKNLEKLVALNSTATINNVVGYIGKTVDVADGNKGILTNGNAAFSYDLPAGVKTASVTITNASGQVVFEGTGSNLTGKNVVNWDGVSSVDGSTQEPGIYSITVNAKDAAGKPLTSTTYTTGTVSSVDIKNGTAVLTIGTLQIPIEKVVSIRSGA